MSRPRQPWLFRLDTPLRARLGDDFPASVPCSPGVYFFHDGEGTLLYIGQSSNLRQRLGSYRHVAHGRHPRRTLRLVNRIAKVDWRICASPAQAEDLERTLLLEYRPPFNRAGTWRGAPWWFETAVVEDDRLLFGIVREPSDAETHRSHGPLPASFRYTFASLARCTSRLHSPGRSLWAFPAGLLAPSPPLSWEWTVPNAPEFAGLLHGFVSHQSTTLLDQITALPSVASASEQSFWDEELDRLRRFESTAGGSPSQPRARAPQTARFIPQPRTSAPHQPPTPAPTPPPTVQTPMPVFKSLAINRSRKSSPPLVATPRKGNTRAVSRSSKRALKTES